MIDFLVVGAGLYGAVFARRATQAGYRCLVLEKRPHLAGNCYTQEQEGILVHAYGPHIFHTSKRDVWDFVNQFDVFNHFRNAPIANYKGEIYNLPFNMNTFNKLWGVVSPQEAQAKLNHQREAVYKDNPQNLEEQALNLVGREIYEKLIKGYTEKQWGRPCTELPAFIIRRLPLRFLYDNRYFNDPFEGIPEKGYTKLVERMLEGIEVKLNTDYLLNCDHFDNLARCVVYTGAVDAFFQYQLGKLKYRSLRFEQETLLIENFQGNAVVNYTDMETPYTRIIEHKHFSFAVQPHTIISREYSLEWREGQEPYYPVNDESNNALYQHYRDMTEGSKKHWFGGRLATYQYLNMDQVVLAAIKASEPEHLAGMLLKASS